MTNYMLEYTSRILSKMPVAHSSIRTGDIIEFYHDKERRMGVVISPKYEDKLHVISFQYLSTYDFDHIFKQLLEGMAEEQNQPRDKNLLGIKLYEDIKPHITGKDVYRTYKLVNVSRVSRVTLRNEKPIKKPQEKQEESSIKKDQESKQKTQGT